MGKAAVIFLSGGALYTLTELLWRGHSHWSMGICGGLAFMLMYGINSLAIPRRRKWTLSAAGICTLEFYAGWLLNLRLGLSVWDYSALPGDLLGQICPLYALFWFLLSIPGMGLCSLIARFFERLSNSRWAAD